MPVIFRYILTFKKKLLLKNKSYIIFFLILLSFRSLHAQNSQVEFGKNRVQFKEFKWKYISTKHFNIYYYGGGNSLAHNAARYAETNYGNLSDAIGYPSYSRINLIVYNSIIDLQQSNIGLENAQFVGGETDLIKAKIEIGFTGSHVEFQTDIKREIATLLINQMMYGGTFKEMVQASYVINLPDWYTGGVAAYLAEGWSSQMELVVRDVLLNRKNDPSKLSGQEAIIAGQSFWNYIAKTYGEGVIPNILNLTRIIHNEEEALNTALGIPFDVIMHGWRKYYSSRINQGEFIYQPSKKNRLQRIKFRPYKNESISYNNDSSLIAYGENFEGKVRVKVYNFKKKKSKVVFSGGYRLIGQKIKHQLPLVSWRSSEELSIVFYKKGKPYLVTKNIKTGKRELKKFITFDDIQSIDYCDISDEMVLSGVQGGRSDLYIYDYKKDRARQITKDIYADFNPQYLPNSRKIVWSSNRQNDRIKIGDGSYDKIFNHYKLFLYDDKTKSKNLTRLMDAEVSASHPIPISEKQYYFLGEYENQRQIYRLDLSLDSVFRVSNFENNVKSFTIGTEESKLFYIFQVRAKDYVYEENAFSFSQTYQGFKRIYNNEDDFLSEPELSLHQKIIELNISDYTFKSDTLKQQENERLRRVKIDLARKNKLKIRTPKPYYSLMAADYVVGSLVLDQLRGAGILFNFGTSEMFGNHKFTAYLMLITNLKSSSFGASYQFLKKRQDLKLNFDRYSLHSVTEEFVIQRYTKNDFELEASHPFSISSRISLASFFTTTRFTDLNAVEKNDVIKNYLGLRTKYVLDNTKNVGLNMLVGSRGLALLESYQSLKGKEFSFSKFVLDFRTYKKIHKQMILAMRGSYGQFIGNSKKNFMLGGIDNWFFPATNYDGDSNPLNMTQFTDNSNILFNEFATSLRGFDYNELYGNKYIMFNAELRVPIIRMIQNGPIASSFLRNLQLTGFYDVGSAWNGKTPFTENNSLNTNIITDNVFSATVVNYFNPFLYSYGLGARSLIYGYYVKLDLAWGVKNYIVKNPKIHLTLGYDF